MAWKKMRAQGNSLRNKHMWMDMHAFAEEVPRVLEVCRFARDGILLKTVQHTRCTTQAKSWTARRSIHHHVWSWKWEVCMWTGFRNVLETPRARGTVAKWQLSHGHTIHAMVTKPTKSLAATSHGNTSYVQHFQPQQARSRKESETEGGEFNCGNVWLEWGKKWSESAPVRAALRGGSSTLSAPVFPSVSPFIHSLCV